MHLCARECVLRCAWVVFFAKMVDGNERLLSFAVCSVFTCCKAASYLISSLILPGKKKETLVVFVLPFSSSSSSRNCLISSVWSGRDWRPCCQRGRWIFQFCESSRSATTLFRSQNTNDPHELKLAVGRRKCVFISRVPPNLARLQLCQ